MLIADCLEKYMSYCINPTCSKRENLETEKFCQSCGAKLLILDRYRLIRPLRPLNDADHTEIFEVEDRGEIKVLKTLKTDEESQKLVELFEQESKILRDINCEGIPKADQDAYFKVYLSTGQTIHCLVMEKIEGQNLENWIKQNGAISEEKAIDWLRQILNILDKVHKKEFFHRDIKPSNIMLRPDGRLVLIDFGTARRITQTVIKGKTITAIYSHGYTAPEQMYGKAVPQSDFYALGRTFMHLLTGIYPDVLDKTSSQHEFTWQKKATQISKHLAGLINNLMVSSQKDRPKNAIQILQSLEKIERITQKNHTNSKDKFLSLALLAMGVGFLGSIAISYYIFVPRDKCFIHVSDVPEGSFNYGGSTTWAPTRKFIDPAIKAVFPQFNLRYVQPTSEEGRAGSLTGIKMLLKGRIAISQSSQTFSDEHNQEAKQQGFELRQKVVAIDGVAVVVHPSLNINGLTLEQLRDIYTGKIRNWQSIDPNTDVEITPYSRPPEAGGTVDWFIENVLGGQPFRNVKYVKTTTEGIRQLAKDEGGVYFASAPEVVMACTIRPLALKNEQGKLIAPYQGNLVPSHLCPNQRNKLNDEAFKNGQYPLNRNLFVIYKDYPGHDNFEERAGQAYADLLLTNQGQMLLNQAGLVPIRPSNGVCRSR
jgi:phosphate transport system substrate-binding protein